MWCAACQEGKTRSPSLGNIFFNLKTVFNLCLSEESFASGEISINWLALDSFCRSNQLQNSTLQGGVRRS
jgi:hypothetical protein